jgi:DNA polymerase III epsilon subunit family exonuclease
MRKHNLAFIDAEMTGLNILEHEIIELGAIITTPELEVIEEFEIKIKPKNILNADKISLKVSNYNPDDWENAVDLKEALETFALKTRDSIMIGHNVAFDSAFLQVGFEKTGVKNMMHYHKLDTVSLAWAKYHNDTEVDHFSLRELCAKFGIKNEKAHTALSDARATYELYKKLIEL